MKKLTVIILAAAALLAAVLSVSADSDLQRSPDGQAYGKKAATYEVTITNLTPGQPLTPPVVATHRRSFHLFRPWRPASHELQEIAENGNSAPLLAELDGKWRVSDFQQVGTTPLLPAADPGGTGLPDSVTFTITAGRGARYLSFASMLICSNDGFTGVDGARLPRRVGSHRTFTTRGYDAGTEINTEDFADMVPPCQGLIGISSGEDGTGMSDPALAQGSVIRRHRGIQGGSDLLPDVHGWHGPVAKVKITRIN